MKGIDSSSSVKSKKCLDSPSFEKGKKDKQGELFINGPEYLRGSGFYGDNDGIDHLDPAKSALCCSLQESTIQNVDKSKDNQNNFNNSEINELSNQFSKEYGQSWRKNILEIDDNAIGIQNDCSTIQIQEEKNIPCPQIEFLGLRSSLHSENHFGNQEAKAFWIRRVETEGRRHALANELMAQSGLTPNTSILRTRSNYNNSLQLQQQQLRGFSEAVESCFRKKSNDAGISEIAVNIIYKIFQTSERRQQRIESLKREAADRLLDLSGLRKSNSLSVRQKQFIQDLSTIQAKNPETPLSLISLTSPSISFEMPQIIKTMWKFALIAPTSTALVVWDFMQIVFTGIFMFLFSVLLFFTGEDPENDFIQLLELFATLLFLIDIVIQLNTTFYLKDRVVTSRKRIASRYCQSYLITDALSLFVLIPSMLSSDISLIYNPNHSLVKYCMSSLVFLKLATIPQKIRRIEDYFALNDNQQLIRRLFSLVLFTMIAAHLVSIVWHGLAVFEIKNGVSTNWMKKINIQDDGYQVRYIYSLYWSVTTMCTIGYGDIVPTNEYEAIFAAISMVFLTCIFAYSINNIGMILQEIEKNSKQLRDQINTFQRFLDRKKVNIELKSRVRHYLRFLSEEQKDRNKEFEDSIFSKLSNKLREEVTTSINSSIIDQYGLFSRLFSKKTIELMVFAMKEVLVSPNEIIFRDNCLDDQAVYFIQGGQIELFLSDIHKDGDSHLRIKLLEANNMFGELSFFSGLSRKVSARSLNLSTLYKITRNDFLSILKSTAEDFEKFVMIQDQIVLYKDFSAIETRCFSCSEPGHIVIDCPKIHKPFDRQFHSLKSNFSSDMERIPFKRKQVLQFVPWIQAQSNKALFLKLLGNFEKFNTQTQLMLLPNDDEEDLIRLTTQYTSFETSNGSTSSDNENEDEEEEKVTEKETSKKSLYKAPSISISELKQSKENKMIPLDSSPIQDGESNSVNKKFSANIQSESNNSKQFNFFNSQSKNISQQNILEQQPERPRIPFMNTQSNSALAHLNEKLSLHFQDVSESSDLQKSLFLDPLQESLGENTILSEKHLRGSSILKGEQSIKLFNKIRRQFTQRRSLNTLSHQSYDKNQSHKQIKGSSQQTSKALESSSKQPQQLQMSLSKFLHNSPYLVDILKHVGRKNSVNFAQAADEDIENFESMKLFKYYFSHNNYDKILHQIRIRKLQIMAQAKKDRKKKKRLSPMNREKRRVNVLSIDVESIGKDLGNALPAFYQDQGQNGQSTVLQYGVGTKFRKKSPISFFK